MRRREWLLGGGLALVLFVAIAYAMATAVFGEIPSPERSASTPANSALSGYLLAEPMARDWARDARLLTASSTWQPATEFQLEQSAWDFVFYSQTVSATALVSVIADEATFITSRGTEQLLYPGNLGDWIVDSPEVVQTLMNGGGRAFIDEVGQVSLTLSFNSEDFPSWTGFLINTETRRTLTMRLDAASGEVLDVQQS